MKENVHCVNKDIIIKIKLVIVFFFIYILLYLYTHLLYTYIYEKLFKNIKLLIKGCDDKCFSCISKSECEICAD